MACLMMSAVSGCLNSGASDTVAGRLEAPAKAHARALAGDDVAAMRATGVKLLGLMKAAYGWASG